jgi:4-diphosphocytidyl-2-C-methyl-D-erythritol kinase
MYNVFEDFLPRGARDTTDIKYTMLGNGALGATMTGSGPAVIGLFDNTANAQKAYEQLKMGYKECYLTETADKTQIAEKEDMF